MIRTYGFIAKGQKDNKLKAARLIWPGGMSGAPEYTCVCVHFSIKIFYLYIYIYIYKYMRVFVCVCVCVCAFMYVT